MPLSRDHHHGLLCCWKIQQGIQKKIAPARIGAYAQYFWSMHLKRHFEEEEHWLLQEVADTNCRQAIAEHRALSILMDKIASAPAITDLEAFAELLNRHIRFEERVVFPFLEETLAEETLTRIGELLNASHQHAPRDDFADMFWENGS